MSDPVATLRLFQGYGIELEYMIVDASTLSVRPISDQVLAAMNGGEIADEVEQGEVSWSNELVMHVLEMKSNGPASDLRSAFHAMQASVQKMNALLAGFGCRLMPTAMHPNFRPANETKLWPHSYGEVYQAYDRVFDCKGHGWSNLQSIHINLPFSGDDEFGRLHAAIRLVLPLIPAIAASSPVIESQTNGIRDNRLIQYRQNQRRVPIISGQLIPERIYTKSDYALLMSRIFSAISRFDIDGILQDEFLNSRGAIARFQRNAIEIRVTDIQESPRADFAIIAAICALVECLVAERWTGFREQSQIDETSLLPIFEQACVKSSEAETNHSAWLSQFGIKARSISLGQVWASLSETIWQAGNGRYQSFREDFEKILGMGCLAERISRRLGSDPDRVVIADTYRELADCLERGQIFES
jgi:carboxylate-amine ligase